MSLKDRINKNNFKKGIVFASKVGDFVENKIGKAIEESSFKAEDLPDKPEKMTWYKVPLERGLSGDGSEYHIYVKIADPDKSRILLGQKSYCYRFDTQGPFCGRFHNHSCGNCRNRVA